MSFCHRNLYFLNPEAVSKYIADAAFTFGENGMEDAAFDVRLCLKRQGWGQDLIEDLIINAIADAQFMMLPEYQPSYVEVPDSIRPFAIDLETGFCTSLRGDD